MSRTAPPERAETAAYGSRGRLASRTRRPPAERGPDGVCLTGDRLEGIRRALSGEHGAA